MTFVWVELPLDMRGFNLVIHFGKLSIRLEIAMILDVLPIKQQTIAKLVLYSCFPLLFKNRLLDDF